MKTVQSVFYWLAVGFLVVLILLAWVMVPAAIVMTLSDLLGY